MDEVSSLTGISFDQEANNYLISRPLFLRHCYHSMPYDAAFGKRPERSLGRIM